MNRMRKIVRDVIWDMQQWKQSGLENRRDLTSSQPFVPWVFYDFDWRSVLSRTASNISVSPVEILIPLTKGEKRSATN